MAKFGPGTFTVGAEGQTQLVVSCLVNSLTITSDKDTGDSTTKLCGTVKPGATTYTFTLSGNVDTDSEAADGLFALSQSAKGQQLPFEFVPDSNSGTKASGIIVIDPLDFGGEDYGADMTSDFEWQLVGEPDYVYGTEQLKVDQVWLAAVLGSPAGSSSGKTPVPPPVDEPAEETVAA